VDRKEQRMRRIVLNTAAGVCDAEIFRKLWLLLFEDEFARTIMKKIEEEDGRRRNK